MKLSIHKGPERMFSPINIRRINQGVGAPLIDPCTTVRKFTHDDGSGSTHVTYKGWAICPLWFVGCWFAIAITFRQSAHTSHYFERDTDANT